MKVLTEDIIPALAQKVPPVTSQGATRANNLPAMAQLLNTVNTYEEYVTVGGTRYDLDSGSTSTNSVAIRAATSTKAGVMASSDKTKLDGIPDDAVGKADMETYVTEQIGNINEALKILDTGTGA